MKKKVFFGVLLLIFAVLFGALITRQDAAVSNEVSEEPAVYSITIDDFNSLSMINKMGGQSGTWETETSDFDQGIYAGFDVNIKKGDHGASLRLEYDVDSPKNAINGYWTQLRSFDARNFDHFEFWVKGDDLYGFPDSFKIEFKKFNKNKEGREETIKGSYIVKGVTAEWQKISIPLNVMNGISIWDGIREFVITFQKRRYEKGKREGALFFDDLAFVHTGDPGPSIKDIVPHARQKTGLSIDSVEFAKFLIARLKGFPKELIIKKQFPRDDRLFLKEIAKDTWKYFDKLVDKEHSLPLDNVAFGNDSTVSERTRIGDYTNITNIGVYLMCVVSAYDFGFIDKDEAVKRITATLDSVDQLDKYKGFHYNYYDITIFQKTSNFISFVDSGWLAAGIIVVKNAFPEELKERCSAMLDKMDFSFFYDPVEGHMYHGFYTNIEYYSEYHYGALYTEPRAISYIAIGKGDVPIEHWFKLERTFPDSWVWQTQAPKGRRIKEYLGSSTEGGYYMYNDVKFVPSWGGSMFEGLMPTIIIDEKRLGLKGLGLNDHRYANLQIDYTLEKLGYPVFGMSPSADPEGGYSEYGVAILGIKGYKSGVITPHATFLALEFAPEKCIKNLREIIDRYDAYGEFGFYDAIDPRTGKVAYKYLCLDQAMSFIALNNFLNNGAIRNRFHSDKIAKNAEQLLEVEDFFD